MIIGKEIGCKLLVKELGFDKKFILVYVFVNMQENYFFVCFVGVVIGLKFYKIKEGDCVGEFVFGFMGQFEGNNVDGEVKDGSVLYLFGYVNDVIVSIFQVDEMVLFVCIVYDVYVKYDEDVVMFYVFIVNDLLNVGLQFVDEVKVEIKVLFMFVKILMFFVLVGKIK